MRLIKHRIGTSDDRATLRARLHNDFSHAIDEAIRGSGQQMFLAIHIVDAVPLPITITVYLPEVTMTPAIGVRGERVIDILQQGLENVDTDVVGELGEFSRLELAQTAVLRASRVRPIDVGSGADSGTMDVFVVDYWLAVPGTKRVILVNFSTSFAALHEYLLTFFDSIIGATYWVPPTVVDDDGAEEASAQ